MTKINVLIVEDDPAMRVILRQTLLNCGIEIGDVFEAKNGKEGLERLTQHQVDLMLVDIYMPVMDGLEMLEEVRDAPELKDIPAIVVSSESSEQRIDAIMKDGVGFIHKPLTHKLLKGEVMRFLGIEQEDDE
jgi:two-component system, chemotaxis family, chemotaxis protein CheY